MSELPKTFDPASIESRWYAHWEASGQFRPDRPNAEPWTIVNPPPNVTGSLHIGHALDNTLQDILTRHARLKGKDALWVVGTDHAGIATQMVVERQMGAMTPPQKRTDLSREDFIAKVWAWKEESGGEITQQLRRLGCSMDWANERFTMDEGFSKAVLKVFVDLHKQGLLYRDKRLVNWDPGLGTAISDLEVETREIKGSFWHLRYPLADGSGYIEVATTRPETMLADMAVAVNGADARYTALIGKQVKLPITGRLIPIIADDHADPELGSGAVKITPGHDFNDFEVGKRAGMAAGAMLNMLDAKARVVQVSDGLIPAELLGLTTAEARKAVVAQLKAEGFLIAHVDKDGAEHDAEPRTIQTPYGDRSGVVIEPWLTDQWYVDAKTLAQPAIEAVRVGAIDIVPKTWEKTFFNWMENIQPWCVSRQLWWGHQIPAWFGPDGTPYVAETEAEAQALAGAGVALTRDPDVLDTWFSSALWPFATLGWDGSQPPFALSEVEGQATGDTSATGASTSLSTNGNGGHSQSQTRGRPGSQLGGRYPNDVLISGFDILFFWNARMMMQGLHFMKDVPFRTLYLHGLVRAADGAKMSKSKGNVVNPLGLIDQYGADALRFFMAAMESQGRDIKMDEKRVEGYRNFATKLWNAARFAQANGIVASTTLEAPRAELAVNKWIIAETIATVQQVDLALADYRFDGAANAIYQFAWSRFCDWYLELIKPQMVDDVRGQIDDESKAVAGWVLDQILVLLHPFMPFITEELWHAMGPRDHDLIVAQWPMADARSLDPEASREVDWLIRLVGEIRTARNELNVPPGARLPLHVRDANAATLARLERQAPALARLARVTHAEGEATGGAAQVVVDEATFVLPLEGVIDLDAERTRLTKAIAAAEKERDALAGRLGNASFVERAKPEAVEKAKADHADKAAEAARLQAALGRLG
ncbi:MULTISPECIES: valine--tRNA ligase [unclassified Sphingomonas]|uniref:valine--tRNA ligase n=1 Tax=unclassified Sphingomonas TaxID=196159 RepID=UPI0006F38FB4|nr:MULTISPECIES: valine--tRNA ligase [unclassified Sphingomonas]KQN22528.1 valine--tRNA ligase [Sphingomonas sp. Leaf30]MBD8549134.1 valine--tRNA ligase [Sphingomonas sp. CFBP 8764]